MSESQFFTFRKPPDWRRGASYQLNLEASGVSIVREQVYRHARAYSVTHPRMQLPIISVTTQQLGRWFFLDHGGVLWSTDLASGLMEPLNAQNPVQVNKDTLIAAAGDSMIVLHSESTSQLQSFSIDRMQIRWTISEFQGQAFTGFAMASFQNQRIMVLAKLEESQELSLLCFDPSGQAVGSIPLPQDISMEDAEYHRNRYELKLDKHDQGWLLDKESQVIFHINIEHFSVIMLELPELKDKKMMTLCSAEDTDQLWLKILNPRESTRYSLIHIHKDGRILGYGSTGHVYDGQLFCGKACLYLWDQTESLMHMIKPNEEVAVWEPFGRRMGVWISDALDSGMPGTEWHKIVMDALQDRDTAIHVKYYASDHKEAVLENNRVQLDEYIADSSIPIETKLSQLNEFWSKPIQNPQDALIFNAKGRYLWMVLELIGSSEHSPVIQSMEVYFPRETYVDTLPSIYQRHEPSRDFLSRFLSIYQSLLEETDQHINRVTRSFDSNHASGHTLKWLLGWLGITAEDNWTEAQMRALLKQAPVIYSLRGTKFAMELLISIFTGEKPIILEYEQVKPLKEHPELGDVAERLYAADPHVFNVLVNPEHASTEKDRVTLQKLIDASKPAFSTGKLVILQPWVYMDLHSYLGMNTVLSEPTLLKLDGRSSMPHHTITIDVGQDNRVDQHTRLGLDSRLE